MIWAHCVYIFTSVFLYSFISHQARIQQCEYQAENFCFLLNPCFQWAVHVFGKYSMVMVGCHGGKLGLCSGHSNWREQKVGKLAWIFGDVKVALIFSHWSWFIMLASTVAEWSWSEVPWKNLIAPWKRLVSDQLKTYSSQVSCLRSALRASSPIHLV